jgi:hypothetical protein
MTPGLCDKHTYYEMEYVEKVPQQYFEGNRTMSAVIAL